MNTGLRLIKNTSILLAGRIVSILLGIVYLAALSRHVHASGLGVIATATALVSISSLLLNLGLNDVTVRDVAVDKTRAETYLPNLFFLRGGLFLLFTVSVFVTTRLAAYPPETTAIIGIYCFAYLFDELTAVCFAIFNAHEQMGYSAVLQTGRDLLNMGLSLTAIAFKADLALIVAVSALASLVKLIVSLFILKQKFTWPKPHIDIRLCRQLLRTTLPFAVLLMISALLLHVDTFILSLFRPAGEVGWYSSAALLINYALLLPSMFLQAVFPVFSRFNTNSPEELKRVYSLSFKYLLIMGFALCLGTWVTADKVILLIYGPGFEQAAQALRILSAILFWMFGFANGSYLNATGGQGIAAKFAGAGIILTISLSLWLTPRFGLVGTAIARVLPGALFFLPLTLICHNRLGLRAPYGLAFKTLLSALMMAGVAWMALENQISIFLVVPLIAPLSYVLFLAMFGVIGRFDLELISQTFGRRKSKRPEDIVAQSHP